MGLRKLRKLKEEHINLTPSLRMIAAPFLILIVLISKHKIPFLVMVRIAPFHLNCMIFENLGRTTLFVNLLEVFFHMRRFLPSTFSRDGREESAQ